LHFICSLNWGKKIEDIGRREIQDFLTQQRKQGNVRSGEALSASSVNAMRSILVLAFEYACDMEYVEENPCVRVRRMRVDTSKVEAFTLDEQRALELEIEKSEDRRLHGVLLEKGLSYMLNQARNSALFLFDYSDAIFAF
jgi:site-specific recombinase XerD